MQYQEWREACKQLEQIIKNEQITEIKQAYIEKLSVMRKAESIYFQGSGVLGNSI